MAILLVLVALLGCTSALYQSNEVIELTPDNFETLVLKSDDVWVVEFYAPWCGHCKNLVPEYKKVSKALKGVAKVGAVDADKHQDLSRKYNIKGFPTVKLFGVDKKAPKDISQRAASGIVDVVLKEIERKVKEALGEKGSSSNSGSGDVIELTDSNFEKLVYGSDDIWLVEFFAPWCGHCKNLAPHWAKAATALKGKVKLGALDATANTRIASLYGIQGYPTIKFFPKGSTSTSDAVEYDGGRTAQDIINWAEERYSDNIAAPEIIQVTSEKVITDTCEGKPLCVVSVLPHILDCDAKCRNAFIDTLKEMGEKYKKKQWGWVWTEGAAQPDLEESLEIGGFGYPAMAVVNFKKMKYSLLKGSFSKDGINEFLRDISFGRGHTAPVRGAKLPKIVTIDPWDGKDGQLPEEEDIDLSDVELDEKDEL